MKRSLCYTHNLIYIVSCPVNWVQSQCPSCEDGYFGFEIPGYIYLAIHILLASYLLYYGYRENNKSKKVGT